MHGTQTMARKSPTVGQIKRALMETEKASGNGGTGATILKQKSNPVARLIEQRRIGPEELQAATEIETAFFVLSGGLMIKPLSMERQDRSHSTEHWPARISQAVGNYQKFARHWSTRAKLGDPTLAIVIAAVIDQRALSVIEADIGIRHGRAAKALVAGLQDYAARAEWISGRQAVAWIERAATVFPVRHPDLSMAMARARQAQT